MLQLYSWCHMVVCVLCRFRGVSWFGLLIFDCGISCSYSLACVLSGLAMISFKMGTLIALFIAFLVSCGLLCLVSLPRCVVVWSLIFDCGMSCSYSPVFVSILVWQ